MTGKMFMLVATFLIFGSTFASRLLSTDELHHMIVKFANNELRHDEVDILRNIFKVYTNISPRSSNEVGNEAKNKLGCALCRSLIAGIFDVVKNGQSDENMVESVTIVCTSLAIMPYNTCRGVAKLNAPIIAHIIRTTPEATPQTVCGLLLQNADGNVCSYSDRRFEWEVELPERRYDYEDIEIEDGSEDQKPLNIVLLSDTHVDPYYEPFGVADCDEVTCCRKGQTPRTRSSLREIEEEDLYRSVFEVDDEILINTDVLPSMVSEVKSGKATKAAPAGYWGDYRNCDTPKWAFDDVIDRISSSHKNIDAVYYLGDSIDHHVWETTYDMIKEVNKYISDKMRESFNDKVVIIPVIGNHETQPTNQFAPSTVTGEKLNTTWLYNSLADKWDHYLSEEAKRQMRELGSFSMLIRPKLRVISFNSNVAYRYNWWLLYDPLNAKKYLDWLVQELYKAESAGEKVHLLSHMSAGMTDLIHVWTREYNKIINRRHTTKGIESGEVRIRWNKRVAVGGQDRRVGVRLSSADRMIVLGVKVFHFPFKKYSKDELPFSSTISAEFNGHSHTDEFKIYYSSDSGEPINVAWGSGSATAYSDYNLNYKIVTVDTNSLKPLNIVNYVYNLTEANMTPNRRPHWFELYNIKNSFGLRDLSPSSMNELVHNMVSNQKSLLDLYSAFHSKLSDKKWQFCNEQCKLDTVCKIVVTVLWERQKCEELRQMYFEN